jgi:putative membrane protein
MMSLTMLGWHGAGGIYGMHHGFGMMGMAGGMIMFMILLVVLVVVTIVWFSKNGSHKVNESQYRPTTDRSLEILNERYALGEIADEEYNKKKMEIKKNIG